MLPLALHRYLIDFIMLLYAVRMTRVNYGAALTGHKKNAMIVRS